MVEYFKRLSNNEVELMLKAPLLVCILIAGADGTIDNNEIEEAILLAREQAESESPLTEYFREASQDFEDKLKIVIQSYPYEASQRIPIIVEELGELNTILSKLDRKFAIQFYNTLKVIAEKIASSSGGLLGIHTIGEEEAKYVKLEMILDPGTKQ